MTSMGGKGGLSRSAATAAELVEAYLRTKGNGHAGSGNGVGGGGAGSGTRREAVAGAGVSAGGDDDVDTIAVTKRFNQPGLPLTLPLPVIVAARVILVGWGYDPASVDSALGDLYGKPYVPAGAVASACPNACGYPRSCLLYGCRLAKIDELVTLVQARLPSRRQ